MVNTDTELLFPTRVIPSLSELRGETWKSLIESLSSDVVDEADLNAFTLMMVRLGGCGNCNADSFRAMRGCTHCAILTIRRYKYSDQDLLGLFETAKKDLNDYQQKLITGLQEK